jgi:hypothetical protein
VRVAQVVRSMPHWRKESGLKRAPGSCAWYVPLRRVDRSAGRIIKSRVDRSANIEGGQEDHQWKLWEL